MSVGGLNDKGFFREVLRQAQLEAQLASQQKTHSELDRLGPISSKCTVKYIRNASETQVSPRDPVGFAHPSCDVSSPGALVEP